jgi:anthranilate phosphoribosyltransferase
MQCKADVSCWIFPVVDLWHSLVPIGMSKMSKEDGAIRHALAVVIENRSLSVRQTSLAMGDIMSGRATSAQIAAFITALRMKGEVAEEIAGMAEVMRAKASVVHADGPVVDTCGTGGDGTGTFNISTTAAFVVAGAGIKVAKHGNRAVSGVCGSADVLEALGVQIALGPQEVEKCIDEVGMGFMFAPAFHPAMKYAAGPRRELGIRTVFNMLGPLTNPAGVKRQVIGVGDVGLGEKMAKALQLLGSVQSMVVHSEDGLDEISLAPRSIVWEIAHGAITNYDIQPELLGLSNASRRALKGGSPQDNAEIVRGVLAGIEGPKRDVVILNAAAALKVSGKAKNMEEGVSLAYQSINSGRAMGVLDKLVKLSHSFA